MWRTRIASRPGDTRAMVLSFLAKAWRWATPRVAWLALTVLALTGCTQHSGDFKARAVSPTRVGDSAPSAGVAEAHAMPIQGIDVSKYDGDIDWTAVKKAGISFAYLKTTEGGDYADPTFFQNWKAAEAAGVKRGAYHFMYWCRNADQQALFFMVNIPNDADALPPVLDLEWEDSTQSCPVELPPEKAIPMIRTVLKAMEARTGKRPIIYTDINFYRDILSGGAFSSYPFWIRSVAADPARLYGHQPYVYWQFSATGRIPGIEGEVDRNVFNGTAEEWQNWLVKVGAAPAPKPPAATTSAPATAGAKAVPPTPSVPAPSSPPPLVAAAPLPNLAPGTQVTAAIEPPRPKLAPALPQPPVLRSPRPSRPAPAI